MFYLKSKTSQFLNPLTMVSLKSILSPACTVRTRSITMGSKDPMPRLGIPAATTGTAFWADALKQFESVWTHGFMNDAEK